jgi:hypothetical protein
MVAVVVGGLAMRKQIKSSQKCITLPLTICRYGSNSHSISLLFQLYSILHLLTITQKQG